MKDSVIKGNGNSRYLKSSLEGITTWEQFRAALAAGTLPVDLNGINPEGFQQLGDPLNKVTFLKDTTAAKFGKDTGAVPDEALDILSAATLCKKYKSLPDGNNVEMIGSYGYNTFPDYVHAYGIASDGDTIAILVGGQESRTTDNIMVSTDHGKTFSFFTIGQNVPGNLWGGIICKNHRFFAFTAFNAHHKAYTSADAKTWVECNLYPDNWSAYNTDFVAIEFFANRYYAITSQYGTLRVSSDGLKWENVTHFGGKAVYGLCIADGKLIVAPFADNLCYQTADGNTWDAISGTNFNGTRLFYLNGVYLALGFTNPWTYWLKTSADLKTWVTVTSPGKAILGICSTDNHFYLLLQNSAGSTSSDGATLYKSKDGKTWTALQNIGSLTYQENVPYFISPNFNYGGIDALVETQQTANTFNYAGYIYASYVQNYYELYNVLGQKIPLPLAQIETGSYIGTGSSAEHKITCGFSPHFFVVTALYKAGSVAQTFVAPLPAENVEYNIPYILIGYSGSLEARMSNTKIKRLANGISFSAVGVATDSFNMSGVTYTYTFLG